MSKTNGVNNDLSSASQLRGVSYEFRQPLTTIAAIASLLRSPQIDRSSFDEQLLRIELISDRLLSIIDGLIFAGKADKNQVELLLSPVNVGAVLHRVKIGSSGLATRMGKSIRINILGRVAPSASNAEAMEVAIYSMLDVLIRSSISEVIELKVFQKGDEIYISIHDDGESFKETELNTLVSRVGETYQPSIDLPGASGISIYVASTIVSALGGSLKTKRPRDGRIVQFKFPKSHQLSLFGNKFQEFS